MPFHRPPSGFVPPAPHPQAAGTPLATNHPLPRHPPQSDDLLATYYDHRATEMEEAYRCPERMPDIDRLHHELPRLVEGLDVLEIACGTGYWTQVMAPSARSITAVDISESMLRLARGKDCGHCPVTFLRHDAWQLENLHGRFDAAVALFWWSHLPHARSRPFLQQLLPLLRAGSLLVLVDNLPNDCRRTPPVGIDDDGNLYQHRTLHNGEEFDIIKNYPSRRELLATLHGLVRQVAYTRFQCMWLLTCRTTRPPGPGARGRDRT